MNFHNTFRKLLLTSAAVLAMTPLTMKGVISEGDVSYLMSQLQHVSTTTDSIKILLDVYNQSDKIERIRVRNQLINLASRAKNHEVISDVVNELAASTDDAGELSRLIEISENLPESHGRVPLQTVLQMEQAQVEAPTVRDSQIKEKMADFTREGLSYAGNPYLEIQNIYRIMMYLGASSQGPMYYEYIRRLDDLVESLPPEDHAIRNLYYTNAALFYTRKRDYEKAIEFDRKLIGQLDQIKAEYEKAGKPTDDLDYFYYVSYRRMLRNFRGLTPEEIEEAFNQCVALAERNEEAAEAFGNGGLTKSYYYFATGKYAQALPELKKALAAPDISDFRKQELLGLLAKSYQQTGDKNGELEALRAYTDMALEDRNNRRDDMYREIELRNSVNQVLADERMEREKQREQNRVMRKTSITLVYVLAVILIFLSGAYLRLRSRVKELEFKNNKLRKNIEYIFDDGVPKGTRDLRHQNHGLKG